MLQGLPSTDQLSPREFHRQGVGCIRHCTRYYSAEVTRRFAPCRSSRGRSKYCSGPTRCSFASAVNSSISSQSVTTQSVTEAVAKATLDRPLFHHALHSIFSSLAWFGLAWVITRYIRKLAKEHEAPEVGVSGKLCGLQKALCLLVEPSIHLAGTSASIFVRALPIISTKSQASCVCPCWTSAACGAPPAYCRVPPFGCNCVLIAVCSMVSWSSSCFRNEASELFRATRYGYALIEDTLTCLSCCLHRKL